MQLNGILRNLGVLENSKALISQPLALVDQPGATPLAAERRRDPRRACRSSTTARAPACSTASILSCEPGEKVGLVGPSGAGKSTLVNLILRLYDLEGGTILIDGQDIADVTQDSLRANIGVVSQDTALFHRSLRDNIRLGKPGRHRRRGDRGGAAGRSARVHRGRCATTRAARATTRYVGERGVKLSGGQRQRIAIARVMLKDAPILILDEATSALDSEVEAAIQENLLQAHARQDRHRHRAPAVDHRGARPAGRARRRPHRRSRARMTSWWRSDGLYARLWKRQSGGFLLTRDEDACRRRLQAGMSRRRQLPRHACGGVVEGAIDAFHDTDREVLPDDALALHPLFRQPGERAVPAAAHHRRARRRRRRGTLLVGRLADRPARRVDPATLFADHWPELVGLLVLLLVVRTVVMIASAVVEQQVIVPGFYSMVRWQSFRRVIEQPYDFYQNDFAGRIATKIMQGGEAVGDFIVNVLQTMWSFLTFVVLAITILVSLDPLMGVVVALWFLGYAGDRLVPAAGDARAPAARPPTSARSSTAGWSTPSPTSWR